MAQAWPAGRPSAAAITAVAAAFLAVYARAASPPARDRNRIRFWSRIWVATLSVLWMALIWLTPEAAYLAFPLFFLYLHLLPGWRGPFAVALATVVAIVGTRLHGGWTVGGIVGPLVGAAVAVLIGARLPLAAARGGRAGAAGRRTRRHPGRAGATASTTPARCAERARLAREIHDTLAQGLSSIQMLLHAADRADPTGPAAEHVRLARATTADNLAEARRFVRELTPAPLADAGLRGRAPPAGADPMAANGSHRHHRGPTRRSTCRWRRRPRCCASPRARWPTCCSTAGATHATVRAHPPDRRRAAVSDRRRRRVRHRVAPSRRRVGPDSFGLAAARTRVEQLGGRLQLDHGARARHHRQRRAARGVGDDVIRILMADDHPVVRAGPAGAVRPGGRPDRRRRGGHPRRGRRRGARPAARPGADGPAVRPGRQRRRRHPAIRSAPDAPPYVLILTNYDTDGDIIRSIEAGASGYLLKGAPPDELLLAVRSAAAGESALAPPIASRLLERLRTPQTSLSTREIEVLERVAAGRSNTEIAARARDHRADGQVPPGAHLHQAGRLLADRRRLAGP